MSEPKYKVGDMVRIVEEPWNQHAGDVVIIERVNRIGDIWQYDFVIPEQRGGTPENMIDRLLLSANWRSEVVSKERLIRHSVMSFTDDPKVIERVRETSEARERSEVVSAPEPKPLSLAGDRCPICTSPQKDIKNGVAYEFNPGECPSPWHDGKVESVDGGARPDRFDEFAKEVTVRVKMFSPTIGFYEKDMAHVARQWFGGAADGGARELEQAAQEMLDAMVEEFGEDCFVNPKDRCDRAMAALRLAMERKAGR